MGSFNTKHIFLAFTLFVIYGSLYPFDFTIPALGSDHFVKGIMGDLNAPRWSDLISNVILFIPFGFLGTARWVADSTITRRFIHTFLAGTVLAVLLQGMQIYLPTRTPSLLDAICNTIGIMLGGFLFFPLRAKSFSPISALSRVELLACGLMGIWALDALWPVFPGFDMQTLKDGLKPLLQLAIHSPLKILMTAVGWMILSHLWEFVRKDHLPPWWLFGAMATMSALEIGMEENALEWEEMLGSIMAFGWHLTTRTAPYRLECLIIFVTALLAYQGLSPFAWRNTPQPFHWMPFGVSIRGEPLYQISVMLEKCFWYGSLAWLFTERQTPFRWTLGLLTGFLASIEFAQQYLIEHTPEITDPLIIAAFVTLFHNEFLRPPNVPEPPNRALPQALAHPSSLQS